jgi:uncharacterized protein (TIGR02145 family)
MFISSEKITSNYHILNLIGQGGMGDVYKAEHKELGRIVAIKSLKKELCENEQFKARFKNEAQVMARLQHPGIVALYEYIEDESGVYLIMEYAEGMALDDFMAMQGGRLQADLVKDIIEKILEALNYAHQKGVVHRDIKPANIIYNPNEQSIKILDFGIAKLHQEANRRLTKTGTQMGTVYYMSPEQIKGEAVDQQSDIYSLGVLMYQLLSGENPYEKLSSEYLISDAIVKQPLPDLQENIPENLLFNKILTRATAKDKEERFKNCKMFLDAFSEPLITEPKKTENEDKKIYTRISSFYYFLVALMALLVITFTLDLIPKLSHKSEKPTNERERFIVDIDGNKYDNVQIGKQIWMKENLKTSKFRNGEPIPHAKSNEEWIKAGEEKQPAYCYYDNDPANGEKYGKLYNWYAVNDPRGLAPEGWHIPSDEEWSKLIDFLGGEDNAGIKMKSFSGWNKNGNGNNESGFNGLPGGWRDDSMGKFDGLGDFGCWLNSTESSDNCAWTRDIEYYSVLVYRINTHTKKWGFNVRILKD